MLVCMHLMFIKTRSGGRNATECLPENSYCLGAKHHFDSMAQFAIADF